MFDVDLSMADSKAGVISRIGDAIGVSVALGANWDALADVLQDLSWRPASGYEMRVLGKPKLPLEDALFLAEILDDTARFWQAQGKSFRVKVES